jgi:hypothetical protein
MLKNRQNSRTKTTLVLVAILVSLTAYLGYKKIKQNFLDHQLKNLVYDKTKQLYTINYDSINVDELRGDLYLKNVSIKGDTSLQKQLIATNDSNAAPVLFEMFIPELKVVKFKTASALLSKQLDCEEIVISGPDVTIYFYPGQDKHKNNRKTQEELYKQLLGKFSLIKAAKVSVIATKVKAYDFFSKELKFKTVNTSVELDQVAIDSVSNQDTTRTLFSKKLAIKSDTIILGTKKNTAEILGASFDTESKLLALSSVNYDATKNNGFFASIVKGVTLEGIEWKGPVEASELLIDKATIRDAKIDLLAADTKETKKSQGKILTGWIETFSINSLNVDEVSFRSINREKDKKPLVVQNNSFSIRQFKIDRSSRLDESLINQVGELVLNNKEITITSSDRMYKYKLTGIALNTKSKRITIKSFRLLPQLGEAAFTRKARYQVDRYAVELNNIICSKVNIAGLLKGEININHVTTEGNSIRVFRDLWYPKDTTSEKVNLSFPQHIIHSLSFPLKINTMICGDTYIEYKEKNATSRKSGKVRFSGSKLIIHNVSNAESNAGEELTVAFETTFLDQIPLTGSFSFSSQQWKKGKFSVAAAVSKRFDATILNQLTEPMGLIKIEKGSVHSLKFDMKADTNSSKGTLILPYTDLKVAFLGKDGNSYSKKGFFSFLANTVVKNNNNEGKNMRSAEVVFNRKKGNSFFNFIWLTLFAGVSDLILIKI